MHKSHNEMQLSTLCCKSYVKNWSKIIYSYFLADRLCQNAKKKICLTLSKFKIVFYRITIIYLTLKTNKNIFHIFKQMNFQIIRLLFYSTIFLKYSRHILKFLPNKRLYFNIPEHFTLFEYLVTDTTGSYWLFVATIYAWKE